MLFRFRGELELLWWLREKADGCRTKRIEYLEENVAALEVELTDEEVKAIREEVERLGSIGCRYIPG